MTNKHRLYLPNSDGVYTHHILFHVLNESTVTSQFFAWDQVSMIWVKDGEPVDHSIAEARDLWKTIMDRGWLRLG